MCQAPFVTQLTNHSLQENSQFFPKETISVYRYWVKKMVLSLPWRRASSPQEKVHLYFSFTIKGHSSGLNKEDSWYFFNTSHIPIPVTAFFRLTNLWKHSQLSETVFSPLANTFTHFLKKFLMITVVLEYAQKWTVSLSSALDNFREAGEEGGRVLNLARLVPRTKTVPGSSEGGFKSG